MIKYEKTEMGLVVETPYNASFVSELKSCIAGCRWDRDTHKWIVPESGEETLKNLLVKYFGWRPGTTGVTIVIRAKKELSAKTSSVYFHGIPIARATGRDFEARVCDNVALLEGKISSGGSVKNWYTVIHAGTKFRVEQVPDGFVSDDDWEIVETITTDKMAALLEKKTRLENRIAEINAQLAELMAKKA